jgi:hypothetical protein
LPDIFPHAAHHGSIRWWRCIKSDCVESQEGAGTRVVIDLPRVPE